MMMMVGGLGWRQGAAAVSVNRRACHERILMMLA
jgi:hypothetical protein